MAGHFTKTATGIVVTVKVIPRAAKSEVAGVMEGHLQVRLAAPPVDGKANKELIDTLCSYLTRTRKEAGKDKIKKSGIRILRGETSRIKHIEIEGIDEI